MTIATAAPRIDGRLRRALARFDDPSQPIAETARLVGAEAERLGSARPSYEQIRVLVHAHRDRLATLSVVDVLRGVSFRSQPPAALLEVMQDMIGEGAPGRRLL